MRIPRQNVTVFSLAAGCLFIGLASVTRANINMEHYSFVRPITPVPAEQELAAIPLDDMIWKYCPGTPPDIRIVDEEGTPVPHLLHKATEQKMRMIRERCQANVDLLQELPDNQIELTVSLDKESPAASMIEFVTPLQDFERQITVQGKDANGVSTTLVENALIYDYSRFADVRHCLVRLPPNHARVFSIWIENVTDEQQSPRRQISRTMEEGEEVRVVENTTVRSRPFRMDSVKLYREQEAESHRVEMTDKMSVESWNVTHSEDKKQTIVEIETANQPLTGFMLEASNRNFTRHVQVEIPYGKSWRSIGRGTISRISFRSLLREDKRITFAERRSRMYRFVIHNMDNPPIDITGVKAIGPVWQALYIAAPGLEANCYYGAGNARPPEYDTTAISRILDGGFDPVEFSLGTPVENGTYHHAKYAWKDLVGSRKFFLVAVVVMIAVMAGALLKAFRRLDG